MNTKNTVPVLYVPVEGPVEDRQIARDDLKAMQAMVGGYIEPVYLGVGGTLFVNEEGLIRGLPVNPRLTKLAGKVLVGNGFIENPNAAVRGAFQQQ